MLILTLLACPGPADPADATAVEVAPLPVSRACVVRAGASPDDAELTEAFEVSGHITDGGTGEPPGGCRDREEWIGNTTVTWDDTPTQWVTLTDAEGVEWVAAATNPWVLEPAEQIGETATIRWRSVVGVPFAGIASETELAFETPGYRFWLGVAGVVEALSPSPAVVLGVGAEERVVDADCGRYARHALTATWDGETASVATDETYGFGDFALWSGGVQTDVELTCSETSYAYVSAFTWVVE